MNPLFFRFALLALGFLLTLPFRVEAESAEPPAGYRLVWADEFDQDHNGLPDPAKWSCEVGFLRNKESQYYTKDRLKNARVENGQLIIEGWKEDYVPPAEDHSKAPIAHYTAASLRTIGKAAWLYGRIEVRAKLPEGKGVWPAIWMLGTNLSEKSVGWPKSGEIDIMELVGKQPGVIHGTLHYYAHGKHESQGAQLQVDHPESQFHVYSAEWTPEFIDIFVDGIRYNHFDLNKAENDGQNPFRKPQYLILNLALGGDWGGPIDDAIFPQRMVVDYVRVYQKK